MSIAAHQLKAAPGERQGTKEGDLPGEKRAKTKGFGCLENK